MPSLSHDMMMWCCALLRKRRNSTNNNGEQISSNRYLCGNVESLPPLYRHHFKPESLSKILIQGEVFTVWSEAIAVEKGTWNQMDKFGWSLKIDEDISFWTLLNILWLSRKKTKTEQTIGRSHRECTWAHGNMKTYLNTDDPTGAN